MIHASPFFEAILTGEWAETTDLKKDSNQKIPCSFESSQSCNSDSIISITKSLNFSLSHPNQSNQIGVNSDGFEKETCNPDINRSSNPSTQPSPTLFYSPSVPNQIANLSSSNSQLHSQPSDIFKLDSIISNHTQSNQLNLPPKTTNIFRASNSSPTTNDEAEPHLSYSEDESFTTPTETIQPIDRYPNPNLHPSPPQLRPEMQKKCSSNLVDRSTGSSSGRPDRTNTHQSPRPSNIEARIYLKEERDASFQDLLSFVYPHLECVCTWQNASDLMTMSQKFDMPLLKRHVLTFLLSSVAGKPIEAMKIAEEHQLSELYRESSRFLLDNWQGWDQKELESLSSQTLLKLEKRRTWFLERLLKLGLVNSSRDYVCPSSCPDPQHCSRLVDDKWRSAWAASFKFGPPQPSSVYRALRCLEPSLHSPALLLPHTSCQQHALRFFADLFDRMFSQFTPRGCGGGTNGSNHNTGAPGNLAAAFQTAEAANLYPNLTSVILAGLEHQAQNRNSNTGAGSNNNILSTIGNLANINNTSSYSTINSSISSHILNPDSTIRKAKYFLHVELFENNEKAKKRFE